MRVKNEICGLAHTPLPLTMDVILFFFEQHLNKINMFFSAFQEGTREMQKDAAERRKQMERRR
jgi:hypothetical protein